MKLPGRRKGLLLQRGASTSAENERLDSRQWRDHKFDESTGQVFTERTARVMNSNDQYWTRRTRIVYGRNEKEEIREEESARAWENQRSGRNGGSIPSRLRVRVGVRSLQSIALESVIQNVTDLTTDSCVYLPSSLVKKIWDAVSKRCYVSFETWALFSKLLHNESNIPDNLVRYAESFPTPKLQFTTYIAPLISNSFDFITCLCITTPFPVPDLVKISKIRNLGTLEIINTDTSSAGYAQMGVTDRILRSWYLAATNEGAFPILRILRLWNHEDLTSKSVAFLNGFPSLAVFDVRGCRFDYKDKTQAVNLGWKVNIETDILKLLERTCSQRTEYLRKKVHANPGLYHCSKDGIKRLPRDEVATFLVNHQAFNEAQQDSKKSKNVMERVINMDIYGLGKHQDLDDWEHATYKTYARIGELRNDTDIQRAGVPVSDAVICGHEFLNSKPVVLLRLGESTDTMMATTKTSINAVSFIRIKASSAEELGTAEVASTQAKEEVIASDSNQQGNFANNADPSRREIVARVSDWRGDVARADSFKEEDTVSWKESIVDAAPRRKEFILNNSSRRVDSANAALSQREAASNLIRHTEVEMKEYERVSHKKQSSLRTLSIAKTQTSVQKRKKRSLHDMLGSFL